MPESNGAAESRSLEYWLAKACDPFGEVTERRVHVQSFCDQVKILVTFPSQDPRVTDELEGPQIACRLLAHKIQSPNENEALNGLEVLDSCVRNCGARFHNEMAKFRFLNELIKLLSPKYMGRETKDRVKQKTTELLYSWKQTLRHLVKIKQAYDMLKEQHVITNDPVYMDEILSSDPIPAPPPRPKNATFEDEEKSKLLAELLKSNNPEDLQAANRLIKSMVKAEDQKMEKESKRSGDLQTASDNAKLLNDIIDNFRIESSGDDDFELMKELASSLQAVRPTLFRYAGEAAQDEELALNELLSINDDVNKAIDRFKALIEPHDRFRPSAAAQQMSSVSSPNCSQTQNTNLANLLNFELSSSSSLGQKAVPSTANSQQQVFDTFGSGAALSQSSSAAPVSAADDVGMLGLGASPASTPGAERRTTTDESLVTLGGLFAADDAGSSLVSPTSDARYNDTRQPSKGLLDLEELSSVLIKENLPSGQDSISQAQRLMFEKRTKVPMKDLKSGGSTTPIDGPAEMNKQQSPTAVIGETKVGLPVRITASADNETSPSSSEASGSKAPSDTSAQSLPSSSAHPWNESVFDGVSVALNEIRPGSRPPLLVVDRHGVKVLLHYTANRPRSLAGGCPLNVAVAGVSSQRDNPVSGVQLSIRSPSSSDGNGAALVKCLTANGNSLPAYNPIFPLQAISQVLLIAVDPKRKRTGLAEEKVLLDYMLTYCVESDGKCSEQTVSGSFEYQFSE